MKIEGAVCAVSVCSESSVVIISTNEHVFLIMASDSRRKHQRFYYFHFP